MADERQFTPKEKTILSESPADFPGLPTEGGVTGATAADDDLAGAGQREPAEGGTEVNASDSGADTP